MYGNTTIYHQLYEDIADAEEIIRKSAENFPLKRRIVTVSYTHLDVYKRQPLNRADLRHFAKRKFFRILIRFLMKIK